MDQPIMNLREGRDEKAPAQALGIVMAAAATPAANRTIHPLDEQPFPRDHLGLFRSVDTRAVKVRTAIPFILLVGVRTVPVSATLQLDVAHQQALFGS
jgi:hypothetical protein